MKQKLKYFLDTYIKPHIVLPNWLKNRYILTALFFLIWLSAVDNDSFWVQYQLHKQYEDLLKQNQKIKEDIVFLQQQIKQLKENPQMIEKYARENYLLKKDNETLFIYQHRKKK